MTYRSDIDGLRAIALLPVIGFHAGFDTFAGGYVGVDVFFVVSGYLITSIILGDIEKQRFSFAKFYERRARRILPALFLVMACTVPPAWWLMLPREMGELGDGILATIAFVANIQLLHESRDYFSGAAELKPLLHTWSLAVEEQFYLLFPFLMLAFARFQRRRLALALGLIAVASLVLSELGWRYSPMANFYLAPTRAWELMAGALCALVPLRWRTDGRGAYALLGLLMITVSVFAFDDRTPFPSLLGLVPVTGTCLIILYSTPGSHAHRLLSLRPLVAVGLVSYSGYLWHQPLASTTTSHRAPPRCSPSPGWPWAWRRSRIALSSSPFVPAVGRAP